MSDAPNPLPPTSSLPRFPVPPPRRSGSSVVLGVLLGLSLAINFLCVGGMCLGIILGSRAIGGLNPASGERTLFEHHHSGQKSASDKVAIVRIEGVLMEGFMGYAFKQIDQAGKDSNIKAVVVRINSPGGTITESDNLHHRLIELRDGKEDRKGKPIVVSMGSLAASGGYYIAMPAPTVYAEPTTITGSIGVYASFPNIKELGDKYGFHMDLVKAGRVKNSGSPFQTMKPDERYMWQQMVNHAYSRFKDVVEKGRPALAGKLEDKVIEEEVKVTDPVRVQDNGKEVEKDVEKSVHYVRQRADGGIWTADKALEYGLIDKIGYVEDAINEAAQVAGLGDKYEVITYDRPVALFDMLVGAKASDPPMTFDASKLGSALTPRLWYMAPQTELAGFFSTVGR
jgi:protease-4